MNTNIFFQIAKWLFCILCWFVFSPIFYFCAKKWNLLGKGFRIFFLLISPLFLICYLILFVVGLDTYYNYQRKYQFRDKERIERITGVEFPDFKVIIYKAGKTSFSGEYADNMEIEFEDTLSSAFYHTLDSIIATNETGWSKSEEYYFSKIWGNGISAPEGEDSEEDVFFNISFQKNSNKAKIRYGIW